MQIDKNYKGWNNIHVNNIINRHKAYKFDDIVTRISTTLVFQHTDDYNLILSIDKIHFTCLNHHHINKVLQQDNGKYYVVTR